MPDKMNITPEQLQALVQFASKKLGTTPENLARTVKDGGIGSLTDRLSPADAAKLKAVAGDSDQINQLLATPQVQALIDQLSKKK